MGLVVSIGLMSTPWAAAVPADAPGAQLLLDTVLLALFLAGVRALIKQRDERVVLQNGGVGTDAKPGLKIFDKLEEAFIFVLHPFPPDKGQHPVNAFGRSRWPLEEVCWATVISV